MFFIFLAASNNMYGGVATPLALLHHGDMNGRQKQHTAMQNRANSREDNYSGGRNAVRLPVLRESCHREVPRHENSNCENEPLLPPAVAPKPLRNGKKTIHEEPLPAPPLPPHKNHYQQIQRQHSQDVKYTPPWPRGPPTVNPYASVSGASRTTEENVKPYLKPLPKPPGKESPNRPHRKNIGPTPPPHLQPPGITHALPLQQIPVLSLQQNHAVAHQRTPERNQESLRNKLQTRPNPLQNRSPLHSRHSPHHHRHSPLQRHYSDESLGGLYNASAPQRIHSSADEISSLNHSPSISSSDESYSRTTDADASPCVSPPLPAHGDAQQFLFPSDIQVNPCSSPELSPRASLDYIPPSCSLRNNNSTDRSNTKRNNLPPNAVLALAGTCNTVDSSIVTSPPVLDGEESCKGESCASFEFVTKPKQKPTSLLRSASSNGANNKHPHKQRSLEKRMRNENDFAHDANKSNCKRSPSFKESEEITELMDDEIHKKTCNSDRSSKKDGSCQTDKKDIRKMRASPCGNREKLSPNIKLNNIEDTGPFEREIQKLLDEQNLLQNIPPKLELVQQNKDLSLEPLVRYAPNNNNHQVGLAAIQALALGLRVNPAGSVTLQCMSPPRASSKEGSLKRGPSPGPSECHKLQKVSPMDRYI